MATATKETKEETARKQREEAAKGVKETPPKIEIVPWKDVRLVRFSKAEAETVDTAYMDSRTGGAILLYLMKKREGWRQLTDPKTGKPFDSYEDYCTARYISASAGYETVDRVELTLQAKGISPEALNVSADRLNDLIHSGFKLLPVVAARTLKAIEKPANRQQVWAETQYALQKEGKADDSKALNDTIRGVAKRFLPDRPQRQAATPPPANAFDNAAAGQTSTDTLTEGGTDTDFARYKAVSARLEDDVWIIGFYGGDDLCEIEVPAGLLRS